MSNEILQALTHMTWADGAVWREVLELPAAEDDGRIAELLYHVHTVQAAYLQLLEGGELEIPELSSFGSRRSLMTWGMESQSGLLNVAERLGPTELERELAVPWAHHLVAAHGEVRQADVRQSLLQVAFHSTYHRGQINTRIRELGGEPPLVDFIAWVWRGQPEAAWP